MNGLVVCAACGRQIRETKLTNCLCCGSLICESCETKQRFPRGRCRHIPDYRSHTVILRYSDGVHRICEDCYRALPKRERGNWQAIEMKPTSCNCKRSFAELHK